VCLQFLDTMAKDTHYKYLLVFLVPVTLYAVIINWWGLKVSDRPQGKNRVAEIGADVRLSDAMQIFRHA
jgi:hypothetical protein